jgi:Cohesin domain/zinc-ribbon domain
MKTLLGSLVLLLAGAELASAQYDHPSKSPPGKLTVAVGSATASSSQEVEIPIILTGATTSLGALELVLTCDPAILEAKSAERGSLLSSNSLVEYYINPAGRLAVTLVSQDGVNGDGPVVMTHFLVKGQAGQKSALRLENVRAWDGKSHLDFLVTTTAGEFTVGSGWLWWWIAAAVGAVLLLLLLLKVARRSGPATPAAASPKEPPPLKFRCPKCGQPVDRRSVFCNHCGQKLTST